jgi:hypothetical protein
MYQNRIDPLFYLTYPILCIPIPGCFAFMANISMANVFMFDIMRGHKKTRSAVAKAGLVSSPRFSCISIAPAS